MKYTVRKVCKMSELTFGKEEDIAKAKQKTPYYTDKKDFYGITVYGLEDAETYTFSLDDITDIIKNNL